MAFDTIPPMVFLPAQSDLWSLVQGTPSIDPVDLLAAIEEATKQPPLDFRTRLLIRDSVVALSRHWGGQTIVMSRLSRLASERVAQILVSDLGEPGFSTLQRRIMEQTDPEQIRRYLRELGSSIQTPTRLDLGGSGALMLAGLLHRATEDIDAVDQVPGTLRSQHQLMDSLAVRYGLKLAHFQSHYLPQGWEQRVKFLDRFGVLDVHLVDPLDIFISKLFSNREKDRDDLRMLTRSLPKADAAGRLQADGQTLLSEPRLRDNAARNWYILYAEELPIGPTGS